MITARTRRRITAIAGSGVLLAGLGIAAAAGPALAAATASAAKSASTLNGQTSCHLGNGVKHVVQIVFDNVHFFRDNPNVPSDLELLPSLLHFIEGNGTMLSNNHTPLIAHTADDILTTFTGLYGDRQGMPIANGYQAYNTDGPGGTFGTTDPAGSFAYWTDPVFDTATKPSPHSDTSPSMVYSPVPPATAKTPVTPDATTPALNAVNAKLFALEKARDSLAQRIKDELNDAAFWNVRVHDAQHQLHECQALTGKAAVLALSV